MRKCVNYECKVRGAYILTALEDALKSGDAYFTSEADAIRSCQRKYQNVSLDKLKADFDYLLETGDLVFEGSRLYLHKVQRYEDFVASELASILPHNVVPTHPMVDMDVSAGVRLNELQKEAIQMARSHHLSLILGGAGSGKTTLIQTLCLEYFVDGKLVLAAPTGKAARNLTERTGLPARTVHSAGLFAHYHLSFPLKGHGFSRRVNCGQLVHHFLRVDFQPLSPVCQPCGG